MKYRTQEHETTANDGVLELLQIEYDWMSILNSAKLFSYANGYSKHERFANRCIDSLQTCTQETLKFLYYRTAPFTESTIPEIQYFDKLEEAFGALAEEEDNYFNKVADLIVYAQEKADGELLAFLLPKAQKERLMCRAYEAVKNGQDVLQLSNDCNIPW